MKRLSDIAVSAVMVAFLCVLLTFTNTLADGDLPEFPTEESAAVMESSQSNPDASAPEGVENTETSADSDELATQEEITPTPAPDETPVSDDEQAAILEETPGQENLVTEEPETEQTAGEQEPSIVLVDENGDRKSVV